MLFVSEYQRRNGTLNRTVHVNVSQSRHGSKELMENIKNELGFGWVTKRNPSSTKYKPSYLWSLKDRAKIISLLTQMLPFLRLRLTEVLSKLEILNSWQQSQGKISKHRQIHRYTEKELQEIAKSPLKIKEIAKKMGISRHAIEYQRKKLGRKEYFLWTNEELKILKENYLRLSDNELAKLLPKRSSHAIRAKRFNLGWFK